MRDLELEIIRFEEADVIATSDVGTDPLNPTDPTNPFDQELPPDDDF